MKAPIPKYLLIHTITLGKAAQTGAWGNKTRTTITIYNVRLEPLARRTWSLTEALQECSARLFYDCVNSTPAGITFETGDEVTFNSRIFIVESVQELYDDNRLHHLEVLLK